MPAAFRMTFRLPLLAAALLAVGASATFADRINTGEATGAYQTAFCPKLEAELAKAKFEFKCEPSKGALDNIARVLADPRQVGFTQLDILALDRQQRSGPSPFHLARVDDARECVFAVTRAKEIMAYGDLAGAAAKLRFFLPPQESGSAATFAFIKSIDPEGLGRAASLKHAASAEEAIGLALSAEDTVALFVEFPDPDSARFKLVADLGGHFVPVIDRAILRPQVDGRKIYFADETLVANAGWLKGGDKVVTACTPMVVFTGAAERVVGGRAAQDHRDLIATLTAMKPEVLRAPEGALTRLWRRTRELTGESVESMLKLSEDARERARPYYDKGKEAAGRAVEEAKKAAEKAAERAGEAARELIDKVAPPAKK